MARRTGWDGAFSPATPVQDVPAKVYRVLPGPSVFETSVQSRISSTATSLTLVASSVGGGSSLSGFQCFTVDEGRTDAKYICGTVVSDVYELRGDAGFQCNSEHHAPEYSGCR